MISNQIGSAALTCCTSAAVLLNSSMYLLPRMSLCFFSAFWACSSQENRTNASPVGLLSGKRTNRMPSLPSVTGHAGEKNCSTCSEVAVNGSPRMRMITWFSLDRNLATSLEVPVSQTLTHEPLNVKLKYTKHTQTNANNPDRTQIQEIRWYTQFILQLHSYNN